MLHQLEVTRKQLRRVLRLQVAHERLHLQHEQLLGGGVVRERQELVRLRRMLRQRSVCREVIMVVSNRGGLIAAVNAVKNLDKLGQ